MPYGQVPHTVAGCTMINLNCRAFSGKIINKRQCSKSSTGIQTAGHKIHRPMLVYMFWLLSWCPQITLLFLTLFLVVKKGLLPGTVALFIMVDQVAFATQKNMQTWYPKPPYLLRHLGKGHVADTVYPSQINNLHTGLCLFQYSNYLFFAEPA